MSESATKISGSDKINFQIIDGYNNKKRDIEIAIPQDLPVL